MLAAVLLVENVRVARGRLIVIPHANQSGFTHTEPLEAFPHTFGIPTAQGERRFRLGMRLTNPLHQWPDPDLYSHFPSGEPLIGSEARNLNRAYPGRPDGRYTERLAHAIMAVALKEKADAVLDMHEAYPEYPIINMIVAHERAFEIATMTAVGTARPIAQGQAITRTATAAAAARTPDSPASSQPAAARAARTCSSVGPLGAGTGPRLRNAPGPGRDRPGPGRHPVRSAPMTESTRSVGWMRAVVVDAADPARLAEFWRGVVEDGT